MKNHLKRIATPKTWHLNRAAHLYATRPNPGTHTLEMGIALGTILRDHLHLAQTMGEIRKLLTAKKVLVDGKQRKDHRFMVGLFDVVSVVDHKKQYRVVLDSKCRLQVKEILASESGLKVCRVMGKTVLSGGKIQYHLYDGKNVTGSLSAKVGDSVVVELPSLAITKVLPLREGMLIFLTKGKHGADIGVLKQLRGAQAVYTKDSEEIETAKEYVFVIGEKNMEMTVQYA